MDFQTFLKKEKTSFEHYMMGRIQDHSNTQQEEAMRYSLEAGGKRLRPLLLLAVLKAFNKDINKGYPAAAAVEMIHTYSLVHDDLPAMDNDDLRRGKPTNHVQFSESTAILAGDALLTAAFEVISEGEIDPEIRLKLVRLLARSAGYKGMIGGQQADINGEKKELTLEELKLIHLRKTGELIRFTLLAGGIIAEQSEEVLTKLDDIAFGLGIAYQIRDDILDVIGQEEDLGKAVGADEKLGKSTYPSFLGLNKAKETLKEELELVKETIDSIKEETDFDADLLESFVDGLYLKESK